MSASTIAITIEGAAVVLLLVFVVALLRSHAEILRRLAALDSAGPATGATAVTAGVARSAAAGASRGGPGALTTPGTIVGETLTGDAVQLALGGEPTLIAFLSSTCAACEPLWADLRLGVPTPADTRLIVVAKGPERESPSRLRELAPAGQEVVLSTPAFEEFAVPVTPHFVLLDATGREAGRGSAGSWQQILTLLGDAEADRRIARDSSARAARAEDALAAAGVTEGHPSLYPSRAAEPLGD